MKKLIIIILSAFLLIGCKSNEVTNQESETTNNTVQETNILVTYFSATGNTESIAEMISDSLNTAIYEIEPVEPYTLNF